MLFLLTLWIARKHLLGKIEDRKRAWNSSRGAHRNDRQVPGQVSFCFCKSEEYDLPAHDHSHESKPTSDLVVVERMLQARGRGGVS